MGMQIQPTQSMREDIFTQGSGQRCEAAHMNQQETHGGPQLLPNTGQSREGGMKITEETSGHPVQQA